VQAWDASQARPDPAALAACRAIDADIAAILYTSGSTGKPKGVVLSHRNMVAGAVSVAGYLELTPQDRVLAVLPLSFDYGLSQLTTAFLAGATSVLLNHLFPRDIVKAVQDERITGLAAVPPLWIQLAALPWPDECPLRYLTNSGGAMPRATVDALRRVLPAAQLFLMYGLTEAFRSTYLPPAELARRPDSMGRAIPNAQVMVVRPDGSALRARRTGRTGAPRRAGLARLLERPGQDRRTVPSRAGTGSGAAADEMAVWSGDTVRMDEEGYLYFIGRSDDMIKVSGYRVSPTEVEEAVHATGLALEAAAFGVPHPALGQAIVLLAVPREGVTAADLLKECQRRLPAWMVPAHVALHDAQFPRNPNGKIDRNLLRQSYSTMFSSHQ
jgi:acyl-CoA synthetase (AMP-forming)/AMP-acid ligase II